MAEQQSTLSEAERGSANKSLVSHLDKILDGEREELHALRYKLAVTYWVIVVLSIIMFVVGIALLGVPVVKGYGNASGEMWQSLISGGLGVADLAALFLFKPMERIHRLMGDMGQITVALNSFQIHTALRLLQMDSTRRDSVGEAAQSIGDFGERVIKTIQKYFESPPINKE